MKNKNIKNKPKIVVDGFSCILDFPTFSGEGPPDPPYKGNTSIKPSKSFFTATTANGKKKKKKKKAGKPSPIKTIYKKFIFRVIPKLKKRRKALGQYLFCVICNWAI